MATITSAASGNSNSGATWVGGVVPGPDDDVIIAGHVITLNADHTWNSLTLSSSASRLTPNVGPRVLNITTFWRHSAAIGSLACVPPASCTMTVNLGYFDHTANQSQYIFGISNTGVTLNINSNNAIPAEGNLLDPVGVSSTLLVTCSQPTANITVNGYFDTASGQLTLFNLTGGTLLLNNNLPHNPGLTATSKILVVSGTGVVSATLNGPCNSLVAQSTTGLVTLSNSNATVTINGDWYQAVTNNPGALLHVSAGLLILNGKASHVAGSNTLTIWVAGGTFRWEDQTVTITETESVTLYASAGLLDFDGLIIENYNKFVGVMIGTSSFSATGAVLTNYPGAAGAINFMTMATINTENPAPTLPAIGDVAAGTVYGYGAAPLTGTGLAMDPAVLAAAIVTSAPAIRSEIDANSSRLADIEADTQNIQSRIPASLFLGFMRSYVEGSSNDAKEDISQTIAYQISNREGDWDQAITELQNGVYVAANGISAASIATGAFTNAKFATDSIDASKISSAAVAKIQLGLPTSMAIDEIPEEVWDYFESANGNTARDKIQSGLALATMLPPDLNTLAISLGGVRVAGDLFGNSLFLPALATTADLESLTLQVAGVKETTDRLNTMLVQDGTLWQFTVDSHALIPSGGATPEDFWEYFVATTGDAAAVKIGQSSATALLGSGDCSVTVSVTDNHAVPIRFAVVNVYGSAGESLGIYGVTNALGEIEFQLNAGSYLVAIGSVAGFESHTPEAITVGGGAIEVPVMLTRSPTIAPSNPALCIVRCRIVNAGGKPLRNAIVEAVPLSRTTSYDQVLVTLVVTSATTNEEGYCELVLPRAASLIGNENKQYRFTVRYETRAVFASFVGLVPDTSEAWLEDILNS